ncbi:MAG: DUF4982 domain-containing protein [Clostridiales bacterium]|jgi:beta-galactosidase|nr:DUF4982 domain-containing protein [Clostridiales bacterium]
MLKTSFNQGWVVNPSDKSMSFMNREAVAEDIAVTLPYDDMLRHGRDPQAPTKGHTGYFPDAVCTLLKKFEAPKDWRGKTVLIEFEGVYANSMVYVNGDWAGGCPHGYTCFRVDISDFLKDGENEIKVQAKTCKDSRWYTGVGIFRGTSLMIGGEAHITENGSQISILESDESSAVISVLTTVANKGSAKKATRVEATLVDADGKEAARGEEPLTVFRGKTESLQQRLYLSNAHRWEIDTPYLYTAITRLYDNETGDLIDESSTTFGVRTLSLDPVNGLRINGKTVKLRGACVHHDNGLIGAAAIPRAEERRVQLLKAVGFNAVRSAHNPISKAFLDACDREGVVVMDELTDMWTRRKSEYDYSTAFPTHWPQLVQSIVDKDFNHPSVVMYSIGNEIMENGTPHGAEIGRQLAESLRKADPSRYTINSANLMMAVMDQLPKPKSKDINEAMTDQASSMGKLMDSELVSIATSEAFAAVDIAGYNYASSRYVNDRIRFPNRVICGSETFPKQIASNWKLVQECSHVIGDFTWTGWDYLGEAGIGAMKYAEDGPSGFSAPYPWYIAWCGDIDITGQRRPASYYREIVFGLRKEPYIAVRYPHSYGKTLLFGMWDFVDGISSWTWTGFEGKPVEVEVYAPGDSVELYCNSQKVGEAKLQDCKAVIATIYQPGELTAIAFQNGIEISKTSLATALDKDLRLEAQADRQEIFANDADLCYIDIALTDGNGVVNNMSDRPVTAEVTGAGTLLGLGSANPKSEESFLSKKFDTFNGRLLAIVRPTGVGDIQVRLSAEGCEDALVSIKAI